MLPGGKAVLFTVGKGPVVNRWDSAQIVVQMLASGERKAILLGNAAAHHANASSLLALANWIGEQTGATVGYLTEAANTVGAQLVNAMPGPGGMHAGEMFSGALKAVILLNRWAFSASIRVSSMPGMSQANPKATAIKASHGHSLIRANANAAAVTTAR